MPELPEVEVLVRHLRPCLEGCKIRHCEILRERTVRPERRETIRQRLCGLRVEEVRRRGKYIVIRLSGRGTGSASECLLHLGMTGRVWVEGMDRPLPAHAVMVWELDGRRLVFSDPRGFGWCGFDGSVLKRLGPEPLGRGFYAGVLARRLGRSRQAIKGRLLDQGVVAGLGNIYASESLWVARISPFRQARDLTSADCGRLVRAIRQVLRRAIRLGSSVPLDWGGTSADGLFYFGRKPGLESAVQERFAVYDRAGERCFRCGEEIRRAVQAGRSTYYCPGCQG